MYTRAMLSVAFKALFLRVDDDALYQRNEKSLFTAGARIRLRGSLKKYGLVLRAASMVHALVKLALQDFAAESAPVRVNDAFFSDRGVSGGR